jgi:hypothetical protein
VTHALHWWPTDWKKNQSAIKCLLVFKSRLRSKCQKGNLEFT